jgi:hypothetical protein
MDALGQHVDEPVIPDATNLVAAIEAFPTNAARIAVCEPCAALDLVSFQKNMGSVGSRRR